MKKTAYLTPETTVVLLQMELNLCISGTPNPNSAFFEEFEDAAEEFEMF